MMRNIGRETIVRDGKYYLVSTVLLDSMHIGGQYETMVFPCTEAGQVTDWGHLTLQRYMTEEEALNGHDGTVAGFVLPSTPKDPLNAFLEILPQNLMNSVIEDALWG